MSHLKLVNPEGREREGGGRKRKEEKEGKREEKERGRETGIKKWIHALHKY